MKFIQQTFKGKNDWWRWAIVLVISFFPYFYNVFEYLFNYENQVNTLNKIGSYIGSEANLLVFKSFVFYVFFLAILLLGVKFLHKRTIVSIFNSTPKIRYKRITTSFVIFGLLLVLGIVIEYLIYPKQFTLQYNKETFWQLLFIVLVFSLIKVVFQEAFFRGYLLQGLALLLKSKWLAVLSISLIFGGIFSLNANSDYLEYNLLLFYMVTDIILGIIILLDDGIELAIGIGWVNNVVAYVLVTHDWMPFKTDALFLNTTKEPNYLFLVYLPIFLIYPLGILCYSYIYKWKNCNEKLYGKVQKPKEVSVN